MIDIDKFPKTFEKSKTAFKERWHTEIGDFGKIHWMCIRDIETIEENEKISYSTRCVDMLYKMFCRVFTEAERSWFFTLFTIRERKIDESCEIYDKMAVNNVFTEEELLEELRTYAWHIAERKKILDEEVPLTQKAGIDYERFQKKLMWFLILSDKLTDLDEETFEPNPWLEGCEFNRVIAFQSISPGFD